MPIPFRLAPYAAAGCLAVFAAAPAAALASAAWTVDKAASRLSFKSSFGGDAVEGAFRRWDAQITFDPKALAASRAVVTIDVGSAATGVGERDQALPSADWFNAARFPKATFATRSFKDLGGGRYQAIGDLTIRGVSKPLVLPFTVAITGDQARMSSQVAVNRRAFGVGQGQFAAAETVPLDVTVNVSLVARRAK
jgi:polyisoprenoid-binding protein YceI